MKFPNKNSVKICGISTFAIAKTAVDAGAGLLGFIHFAKSPRHLPLADMTSLIHLIRDFNVGIPLVAVVVDPDDALLDALANEVKPDLIQLHGHETPERVAEIAARGLPLIKAISVSNAKDLETAAAYAPHVRYLMFDAKTPKGADMPGGLGISFDWTILKGYAGETPWFLAGGLTPDNVAEALRISGAPMVDVSSGVESAPGVKDPDRISAFLRTAKSL